MGHGSGAKHAGSIGKAKALTRKEIDDRLEPGSDEYVRELARENDTLAIRTLARAAGRRGKDKAPWSVAVNAAGKLVEIGHGRSATQEPEHVEAGLTVIVNQLTSDNQLERVISGVQVAKDVAAALDIEAEATPSTEPEDG